MSNFNDIFNSTFFICLGLILLACAGIILYFESKIREQNHKFTSMLSLISSMAEELNYIKAMGFSQYRGDESIMVSNVNTVPSNNNEDELIKVSDGEDSDSDSDSDDNDSMDDSASDSDENDSDNDSEKNIKHLKFTTQQDNIVITENKKDNIEIFDLEDIDESDDEDNSDSDSDNIEDLNDEDNSSEDESDELNMTTKLNLESFGQEIDSEYKIEADDIDIDLNTIVKEDTNIEETTLPNLKEAVSESLKKINISNLDDEQESTGFLDYKKCSVTKLRNIVVEKGLVSDASKLKKSELLTLLGSSE